MSESPTEPTPDVYGVTVDNVRWLATHVGPNPTSSDPDFGDDHDEISDAKVQDWIEQVADGVRVYLAVLARHSTHAIRWPAILGAARTAVTAGAASYLVSAAYPTKAGTNRNEAYSAELWARYEAMVGLLSDLPATFATEDAVGVVDETGAVGVTPIAYGGASSIPPTLFVHQSNDGVPRAPGAEYPAGYRRGWPW